MTAAAAPAAGHAPLLGALGVAHLDELEVRLAGRRVPLVLTLILLVTATSSRWYVSTPITVAVVLALVLAPVAERSQLWFGLCGVLVAGLNQVWFAADNHQYLIVYWTLAIGLSLLAPAPEATRAHAARWLIAAVFVLAFAWKALSAEFNSGAFFELTLLTDGRFAWVASLLGGVDGADLAANREAMAAMSGPGALDGVTLAGQSARLDVVSHALTWWTLLIEGAIAAAFLAPRRSRLRAWRDGLLVTFIVTTYAAAPVVGFGWILAILGLAQVDTRRGARRLRYLGAIVVVRLAAAPWDQLLIG